MSLKTIAQKSVATMFFMLCIMSTLDFKVMEYSSLSKSLSFCILTAMLSLALNIFLAFGRKKFPFSKSVCAICLWGLYIATYNFITPSEEYRLLYLFSGVMFIVTLTGLLSVNLISKKHIENGLLAIALLHIIYIVGQMAGIIKSSSEFFSVTGSAENPNATAMYLAGVTPLAFNRLRESANKTFYVVLLLVLIVFIILLRCRSAYIGLAVAALVLWLSKASIRLWLLKHSKKHTAITIFVVVSILMFLGYCLYGMKKASADGRIMVWKISATMIAEKPSGYGYGMFEKNYNIFQSDYFANHGGSYNERTNATFTPMAYNDYIEQTVEGGVPGGLGLVMFYALLAIGAIRRQLYTELSVILAFATISLFNFVYTSIQPWLLLLCFGAFSLQIEECHGKGIRFAPYLFALLSIYLMYTGLTKAGCQLKLSNIVRNENVNKDKTAVLLSLNEDIGTSELYWRIMARQWMKEREFGKAIACLNNAGKYSSSPEIYYMKSRCHYESNDICKAIERMLTVKNMIPSNFQSRFYLMNFYHVAGNKALAIETAEEIIEMPIKIENEKAHYIKTKANLYIKNNK